MEVSNLVHCYKHYKQHKQLATFKSWYKNSFNGGLFINNFDEIYNLMEKFKICVCYRIQVVYCFLCVKICWSFFALQLLFLDSPSVSFVVFLLELVWKRHDAPRNISISAYRLAVKEFRSHKYCHHSEKEHST